MCTLGRDSLFQSFGVLASLVVGPCGCAAGRYIYILRAGGVGYDLPFLALTLTVFSGGFRTLWLLLRVTTRKITLKRMAPTVDPVQMLDGFVVVLCVGFM